MTNDTTTETKRPNCADATTTRDVQTILLRGGGTPRQRAVVAVGLIEGRVRRAHKLDGVA